MSCFFRNVFPNCDFTIAPKLKQPIHSNNYNIMAFLYVLPLILILILIPVLYLQYTHKCDVIYGKPILCISTLKWLSKVQSLVFKSRGFK